MAQVRIVLSATRNPLNIGAAARAMANFGLEELVLVSPYSEAWRRARSARAGAAVLEQARVVSTLPEAIADCEFVVGTAGLAGRRPEGPVADWTDLAGRLPEARTALVFGNEKTGLTVAEIGCCHVVARIATAPAAPSMNLGQAVAVCAYELSRHQPLGTRIPIASSPAHPSTTAANWEQRERLALRWVPVLEHIGVFRPEHRGSQTRRLRRMLLGWGLGPADIRLLLGVARELRRVLGLGADQT